jgi:hypothetical protein
MKSIIFAALFAVPFFTHAAQELHTLPGSQLQRLESISVSGGTLSELTEKIKMTAVNKQADHFKITSVNLDNRGYATATLYSRIMS